MLILDQQINIFGMQNKAKYCIWNWFAKQVDYKS